MHNPHRHADTTMYMSMIGRTPSPRLPLLSGFIAMGVVLRSVTVCWPVDGGRRHGVVVPGRRTPSSFISAPVGQSTVRTEARAGREYGADFVAARRNAPAVILFGVSLDESTLDGDRDDLRAKSCLHFAPDDSASICSAAGFDGKTERLAGGGLTQTASPGKDCASG